jgi:hypothetical protein
MKFLGLDPLDVIASIIVAGIIALALAWPTQILFNYVIPSTFPGVRKLDFEEALYLNLLCGILFRKS